MLPRPGCLQEAISEGDVDLVKAIVRSCQTRHQLDDLDGCGRTALMMAAIGDDRPSGHGNHAARQMMQLIWNRYRQLGCGLKDLLLYEHQGVYEQWNLLQFAAKYSCEENLELALTFYEYVFNREGLTFLGHPKYLDMNHVADWARPIISHRILSGSSDEEQKMPATRSRRGTAKACAGKKVKPSTMTSNQVTSSSSQEHSTVTEKASPGAQCGDRKSAAILSKKRAASNMHADGDEKKTRAGNCREDRRVEMLGSGKQHLCSGESTSRPTGTTTLAYQREQNQDTKGEEEKKEDINNNCEDHQARVNVRKPNNLGNNSNRVASKVTFRIPGDVPRNGMSPPRHPNHCDSGVVNEPLVATTRSDGSAFGGNHAQHAQPDQVDSRTAAPSTRRHIAMDDDDDEVKIALVLPSYEKISASVQTLGALLEHSLDKSGVGGTQRDLLRTILHLAESVADPSHRVSLKTILSVLQDSIRTENDTNEHQLMLVQAMLAVVDSC